MKFSDQKTPEEVALEKQLHAMQPTALSDATLESLEQRLQASPSNNTSGSEVAASNNRPSNAETITWRPIVWSIAAILMIGLWMMSVYLPQQPSQEPKQAHQQTIEGADPIPNEIQPKVMVASNETPALPESVVRNLRLTNVRDEGIVMSIGNTPMKRLHYEFIDTYTWVVAQGGGQMRMEVPRSDFVLVPVSTY